MSNTRKKFHFRIGLRQNENVTKWAARKQNVIWKCTIYITLLKKKLVVWIISWKWVNISVTKEKKKITEKPVVIIRFTWQNASQWKLDYYLPKGSQCRGSGTLDPCHSQHPPTISKNVVFFCMQGFSAYINVLFPHSHLELCPSNLHLGSPRLDSLIHYYYLSKLVTLLLKCEAEEQSLDVWIVDKELHYLRKSLKHSSQRHCFNGIFLD